MRQLRFLAYCVGGIILALGLAVVLDVLPLERNSSMRCWECGSARLYHWTLGIPASPITSESSFTRFYLREVDPGHVHKWRGAGNGEVYLREVRIGDVQSPVMAWVDSNIMISILRSFPTRRERKAFVDKFCCLPTGHNSALFERICNARDKLRAAYKADPARKDWRNILGKLGLWP